MGEFGAFKQFYPDTTSAALALRDLQVLFLPHPSLVAGVRFSSREALMWTHCCGGVNPGRELQSALSRLAVVDVGHRSSI